MLTKQKMIKKSLIYLLVFFSILVDVNSDEKKTLKIGSEDAKITVKTFSSLTCPHCANFHDKIFKELKAEFIDSGKVKFEHHSFPLDLAALNAEKIIRAISNNEKRFQLLGELYKKQNQWAVGSDINKINESLKEIGLNFGLNADKIDLFLKDEKIQDQILEERINAQKKYKISSTPTIYVNKKKYEGKHKYKDFKKFLEKNL
jgi:protein-disulfide isomerase